MQKKGERYKMKKIIAILLAILVLAAAFSGCTSKEVEDTAADATSQPAETGDTDNTDAAPADAEEPSEPAEEPEPEADNVTIRLGGLKGPTSMGMVKLLEEAEAGNTQNPYEFQMAASADEITPLFLQGQLDIIAVPANLGAVLYNNSNGAVKMIAINTLGVIYIVENGESVTDWESLRGKTIYATGKGSTPEYAFKYLLEQYGLDPDNDVTIEWKSEPTEVVAAMKNGGDVIAMLPQPFVTVAQTQVEGLRVVMSLTEQWDALNNGSQFITAGLIARAEFVNEHPQAVAQFLEEYAASTAYVNENVEDAAQLVEKYDIVKAPIAQKAIPACNIVCITGNEMADSLKGYFEVLYSQNPAAVGKTMPADEFYYVG